MRIPPGSRVVKGANRFLIPGLIDMHVHPSKARASSLGFVVHGVTTVRDMGGDHAELLRWRRDVREGTRVGPRMLLAGPYLESARNIARMRADPPEARVEPFERTRIGVASPGDADRIVDSLAALDIDHLKIRTVQDRATYLAINRAAERHGLPVVGHVFGISPELVLEAGQDGIEHFFFPALDSLTREARMDLWRQLAGRHVAVVPTLVTITESAFPSADSLRSIVDDSLGTREPRRRYLARFLELDWREQVLEADDQTRRLLQATFPSITRNLREMHQAGVPLLAGSDLAVINIYPGSSLHRELELFVTELQLTPSEALERATVTSAEHLGIADSLGTITPGKVADLVLLEANPLDDIANLRAIGAVVVRGRLFLAKDLEQVRQDVLGAEDLRVNDWRR